MNDVVSCDDMLMAMAESLVEKQPVAFTDTLVFQDTTKRFKIGGKPPREIFYRNTLTFLTKLPPAVPAKQCMCKYVCSGGPADIKCHSCAVYDPCGKAFYCRACFAAYHPVHRVPHLFTPIERDADIPHTLQVSHRLAEVGRYAREGADMLAHLHAEHSRLVFVADDEAVDDKLRVFGRRAVRLEENLQALRDTLRADLCVQSSSVSPPAAATVSEAATAGSRLQHYVGSDVVVKDTALLRPVASGYSQAFSHASSSLMELSKHARTESNVSQFTPYTLTDDEEGQSTAGSTVSSNSFYAYTPSASFRSSSVIPLQHVVDLRDGPCTVIQAAFKGHLARLAVSLMMAARNVRVWSVNEARDFYYDRLTGSSTWVPPKLLLARHLDDLPYVSEASTRPQWACKLACPRRRPTGAFSDRNLAALTLQQFGRCVLARRMVLARANSIYRRIWDAESACHYYADIRTGETSWVRLRLYLNNQPPLLTKKDLAGSRRDPRTKRMT